MHVLQWYTKSHVLFKQWTTVSISGILWAVVAACLLSICVEFLNHVLIYCKERISIIQRQNSPNSKSSDHLMRYLASHGAISGMNSLAVFTRHTLMLIIMTFNLWVLISAIVGHALGNHLWRVVLISNRSRQPTKARSKSASPSMKKANYGHQHTEQHTELLKKHTDVCHRTEKYTPPELERLHNENRSQSKNFDDIATPL